jgi:predicted metal-dependent HD superfamily phosphohydrolase
MRKDLRERWLSLWEKLGGDEKRGQAAFGEITLYYGADPNRAYHNLNHLEHGLRELDEIRDSVLNADLLELEWWFHDIIYTIGPKARGAVSDEELSADFLMSFLEDEGCDNKTRTECRKAIMCTMHSDDYPPTTLDQKFLVDIDLAIFGQPDDVFDEYERNVRIEYAWVDDVTYAKTRTGILGKILARTYIFEKYEVQARANLTRSIEKLLQGS